MNNFVFNNKNSYEDMGLITLNDVIRTKTQEVIENIEVEGRKQGTLTRKTGNYKDLIVERRMRMIDFTDYEIKSLKIIEWLEEIENNKLFFDDYSNKCYIVKNAIVSEFKDENHLYTEFTIKFICEPFMRLNGEFMQEITNNTDVVYNGDIPSEPTLLLTLPATEQNIQITIGNDTFQVNGVKNDLKVDSGLFLVISENIPKKSIGAFPKLVKGYNNISWTGNVIKFEILKNTLFRG